MRNVAKLSLMILALNALGCLSARAGDLTKCVIYVGTSKPCVGATLIGKEAADHYKTNAWFRDTDKAANLNAGRCLERAAEYRAWCSDGRTVNATFAYAVYQVNDVNQVGSAADVNRTTITNGVDRWLRFHD